VSTTGRIELIPELPAIGEFVPGYEATSVQGLGAPRGTPAELIELLNREINAGLADPMVKARLSDLGNEPYALSPADYGKLLVEDTEKWGKVVRAAQLKPE
jgi:tripartite-type tricarboxylate transporter receptor subunit TctC